MQPWVPELEVTDEIARELIEDQFPQLAPIRLQAFESGWDNRVIRVNGTYLFRFPQREIALAGVEREIRCLPLLLKHLEMIPNPIFVGKPSANYPWPFFGYEPLEGRESSECELNSSQKVQIARTLGTFLKKLHSLPAHKVSEMDLPEDPLGRLDFGKRVPMTEARLDQLEKSGFDLPYTRLRELLRAGLATPRLPCRQVVHGDLHFRHLLLGDENQLTGVIDWGDLHRNDPAVDLQIYWSFFLPEERVEFLKSYGEISETQLIQARAFSVFENIALLVSARDQGKDRVARAAYLASLTLLKD